MRRDYLKNNRGAALIEVLAAAAIAAVVLAASITIFYSIHALWASNKQTQQKLSEQARITSLLQSRLYSVVYAEFESANRLLFITHDQHYYALEHNEHAATLVLAEADSYAKLKDKQYSHAIEASGQILQIKAETVDGHPIISKQIKRPQAFFIQFR